MPLVVHFTREICKENRFSRAFHRRCLEVMRDYQWKGNVRELRSVVERHLIASDGDLIRVEDLDARLYQKKEADEPRTLKEIDNYLEGIKKQMVLDAVKSCRTKAEAARKLDIPPKWTSLLRGEVRTRARTIAPTDTSLTYEQIFRWRVRGKLDSARRQSGFTRIRY